MSTVEGRPIDLHAIPRAFWEAARSGVFTDLDPGDAIEMVSHEDPAPILALLDALLPGYYAWVYLSRGPTEWRVRVGLRPSRTAIDRAATSLGDFAAIFVH